MSLKSVFGNILKKDVSIEVPAPAFPERRAPRVQLLPLHKIHCTVTVFALEIATGVSNISASGVGLMRDALKTWPPIGTQLPANLQIGKNVFKIDLFIIHLSPAVIGCKFINPSKELVTAINQYLKVELLAVEMIYIGPQNLEPTALGVPHWYHGDNNTELYFVEEPKSHKVVQMKLLFLGHYLEAAPGQAVKFGHYVENEALNQASAGAKSERLGTATNIRWENSIGAETLSAAIDFLNNVPNLASFHRDSILSLIY